jgi:hypothetical protein
MAYVDNEEPNVSYGRIDFRSMKDESMNNLYSRESDEFDREVKDSYEIGQPVNAQMITQVSFIEDSLDREGDLDELFDTQ